MLVQPREGHDANESIQQTDIKVVDYMQEKEGKNLMTEENLERGHLNFNVVFRFISLGGGFYGFRA